MLFTSNSSTGSPSQWLRRRIENIEIHDRRLAQRICQWIPASCPFEHKIMLFGHISIQIPPLCHLNPLYSSLMVLRWRALMLIAQTDEKPLLKN